MPRTPATFPPARRPDAAVAALPAGWGRLLGAGLLILATWAVYRAAAVDIALTIDGRTEVIETHAGTVADLLALHAVPVASGDLVIPGPAARLSDGQAVVVQRARPVRVRADGRVVHLRTHGRSALAVLQEAGIALGTRDAVAVNGRRWPVDRDAPPRALLRPADILRAAVPRGGVRAPLGFASSVSAAENPEAAPAEAEADDPPGGAGVLLPGAEPTWTVDVLRAVPVTVVEDGIPYSLEVAGLTVGDALVAAGIPVYPEDELRPPVDAPMAGVTRVLIARAVPFVVQVEGVTREVRALAHTVGDGLQRAGVGLVGHDYAIPAAETALTPGLQVQVIRVKEDILVQEVPIAFATETQADGSMPLDTRQVLRPGEPGAKRQRIRITYEDGAETSREVIDEEVLREPVAEVVAYGTVITWNSVDTPDGPRRYWRKMRVYATSYSASRAGVSPTVSWYGHTRSGLPMGRGIVAIDTRLINMRTNLYVPGYGIGIAGDTGGGIRRYHIDLGFDDDNYESWHQWVDLYLLEPLPPEGQIHWMLP
jgi:resuscitation-promoting factor RpfB